MFYSTQWLSRYMNCVFSRQRRSILCGVCCMLYFIASAVDSTEVDPRIRGATEEEMWKCCQFPRLSRCRNRSGHVFRPTGYFMPVRFRVFLSSYASYDRNQRDINVSTVTLVSSGPCHQLPPIKDIFFNSTPLSASVKWSPVLNHVLLSLWMLVFIMVSCKFW